MKRIPHIIALLLVYALVTTCEKLEIGPVTKVETVTATTDLTSVTLTGKVIELSGKGNKDYGFCYSTSNQPTVDDNLLSMGLPKLGEYSGTIEGIDMGTKIYVRAYCQEEDAYIYGAIKEVIIPSITLTTNDISDISHYTATGGGSVSVVGDVTVTQRGVCWSTSPNPILDTSNKNTTGENKKIIPSTKGEIKVNDGRVAGSTPNKSAKFQNNSKSVQSGGYTIDGTGTGSFTSELTGLSPETDYYVRTYAKVGELIFYGNEKTFQTLAPIAPTVVTRSVTEIGVYTATCSAEVTYDGGAPVTARGLVWSTDETPTLSSNDGLTSNGTGNGEFTGNLTDLEPNTTYYIRAFATNSAGTSYGEQVDFTTLSGIIILTTSDVTEITGNSAESGGNVTTDGGAAVTARGIVWSNSENPTVSENQGITTNGTGTGSWVSGIVDLTPSNTYYVRAYATNSVGTYYGNEVNFTTTDGLPILTTVEVTSISSVSAQSGGNITSDGGFQITVRGVCWSTSQNPTIADSFTENGTGIGNFTSNLTGLTAATTYYVRAYATNSEGTSYGNEVTFTTTNSETEVFDVTNPTTGKTWMDRNLGASRVAQSSTDAEAYGDLYQWGRGSDGHEKRTSATTSTLSSSDTPGHGNFIISTSDPNDWRSPQNDNLWQGINGTNNPCPAGYRLPTEAEFTAEIESWISNNSTGAFSSPLKFPVAGDRGYNSGSLANFDSYGLYWSSSLDVNRSRSMYFNSSEAGMYSSRRANGRSVRCIKEESISAPTLTTTEVTDITNTTAVSGGEITSNGGATVTARGVVWSTSTGPTVTTNDGISTDGSGTGTFTSNLTGLTASTTYYVRAYATNSEGTGYGNEVSFTTTSNETEVVDVTNPTTGKVWMDRNLGASRAATSSTDAEAYGDLYQWGRGTDGHEKRSSGTTTTLSSSDTPGHGNFILAPSSPYDWRSPQNNNLWQGESGVNNPCPSGYRIPTEVELNTERDSWNSNDSNGAFASPLKLTVAGLRDAGSGLLNLVGSNGIYSTSTIDGIRSQNLRFDNSNAYISSGIHASGFSIRCIKGESVLIPTVTTVEVTSITATTAVSGGNVTDDGGTTITARGVCWSTSENPTITANEGLTNDGTGVGN
ncbi:MAG TPA: FISUMP domain-containing protein, partial [Tenuifilaceae bacterium]|nr:FISUMP domain-containing protein [Tenuifilaceae bacterium]